MNSTITQKQEMIIPNKTFFTLNDIFDLNPERKKITLRFKLTKLIEKSEVKELGYIHRPVGRPRKVFTKNNITSDLVKAAEAENIIIKEGLKY